LRVRKINSHLIHRATTVKLLIIQIGNNVATAKKGLLIVEKWGQGEMEQILHMDSDIPSVYFPIGKPSDGGTCEFATRKCIEYCPSGQTINEHERYALNYFQKHNQDEIFLKILSDYNQLSSISYNAKMIQWFTWGDCPTQLIRKVAIVMLLLRNKKIPQYGFTRNKMLWEIIPRSDILNIGLSIDNLKIAKQVSIDSGKMTAHPDFNSGYAEMIFDGKIITRCNGWWCIVQRTEEIRNSDCSLCLIEKTGCYS